MLYSNKDIGIFGSSKIAIDEKNKVIYMPVLSAAAPISSAIYGFDVSGDTPIIVSKVDLPFFVVSTQFDPVNGKVVVIGIYFLFGHNEDWKRQLLQKGFPELKENDTVEIGLADPKTGQYESLFVLPNNVFPGYFGIIPGGTSTVSEKNHLFVFPTATRVSEDKLSWGVSTLNLDTKEYKTFTEENYEPVIMEWNGDVLQTVNNVLADNRHLNWGTLDLQTGQITEKLAYTDPRFVFVVGGLSTVDLIAGKLYSIIGSGGGPPVAIVTIDTKTGEMLENHYFTFQPNYLVFVP